MAIKTSLKALIKRLLVDASLSGLKIKPVLREGPVTLVGYFSSSSGIGEGARRLYKSLMSMGIDVHAFDATPIITPQMCSLPFRSEPIADSGTVIFHINPPEIGIILRHLRHCDLENMYRVCCWVWETQTPPNHWKKYLPYFHEFWSPSAFSTNALSNLGAKFEHIGYAFDTPDSIDPPPNEKLFKCLIIADSLSSFERKNPIGAVQVFCNSFTDQDDVSLTLKLSNMSKNSSEWRSIEALISGRANIKIVEEKLSKEEMFDLIAKHNVLLNLHRAEGYGLPIVEALLLGLEAIFTNWSSPAEFAHLEGAHGIDYETVSASSKAGLYKGNVWAEPDQKMAAAVLSKVYMGWADNQSPASAIERRNVITNEARRYFGYDRFKRLYAPHFSDI